MLGLILVFGSRLYEPAVALEFLVAGWILIVYAVQAVARYLLRRAAPREAVR
jgi:hypothetical protein